MTSSIKNSPLKLILLSLTLGYLLLVLVFWGIHFYVNHGCIGKTSTLTGDEKIKLAINQIIKEYPENDPDRYQDLNEFHAVNPNCCQLTQSHKIDRSRSEGFNTIDNIDFWDRLNGLTTIVVVRYQLRFEDVNGIRQSQFKEKYIVMDSCGNDRGYHYQRSPKVDIFLYPLLVILAKAYL